MKTKIIYQVLLIVFFSIIVTSANAQRHRPKHHSRTRIEHKPSYKYKKEPHWGYKYHVAPPKSHLIHHRGVHYHYKKGVFYKLIGSRYAVVRAPIGVRVRTLPSNHMRIVINGRVFYYYFGTYYTRSIEDNQYVTVAPPVGAKVDALPDGYKKIYIEDNTYYVFEGVYYKALIDQYGEVWYEVVG